MKYITGVTESADSDDRKKLFGNMTNRILWLRFQVRAGNGTVIMIGRGLNAGNEEGPRYNANPYSYKNLEVNPAALGGTLNPADFWISSNTSQSTVVDWEAIVE